MTHFRTSFGKPRAWWQSSWAAGAGLAFVVILAFSPAMSHGFSDFDDPSVLLEDRGWQGPFPANIVWMFTHFRVGHYQPLSYLSYAIDNVLGDGDPKIFHVTNILLHVTSAVLLWRLAAALFVRAFPAWRDDTASWAGLIVALLWGLHPLRVESVAWVTERRDVLSTVFLLGAALAYERATRASSDAGAAAPGRLRPSWYVATVALLGISVLCKAWGMTFFVIALIMDWYPLKRLPYEPWKWVAKPYRAVLIEKLPLVIIGFATAVVAGKAQGSADYTVRSLAEWSIVARFCQAGYGLVFYILKTLWPVGLCPMCELPPQFSALQARWIIPGVIVVCGGVLLLVWSRRRPALLAAFAAYAVCLGPVLGFLQSGPQLVAERYSYIATIPLLMLLVGGLVSRRPDITQLRIALVAGVCVVLGVLTFNQTSRWGSDFVLLKHALDSGWNGPVLRKFFAQQLSKKAVSDPAHAIAWKNQAVEQYLISVRLEPRYVPAWRELGGELRDLARVARSRNDQTQARELYTKAEQAFINARDMVRDAREERMALGMLYLTDLDRPKEALAEFRAAVDELEAQGNPKRTGRFYLVLAAALDETGDTAGCVAALKKAAEFPDSRDEALPHLADMGVK